MRLLLGFIAGVACGAALMFYLVGAGWVNTDTVPAPAAMVAPAVVAPPAPAIAVGTRPVEVDPPVADAHPLPAVAQSVVPPALPAAGSSVAIPTATEPAPVPADVPTSAVSGLLIPVQGVKPGDLRDTFTQARSANRVHDAIDIMAARGTPVVAVNAGRVVKLFTSKPGGLTVYQFDPAECVIYYYAHLDSYAPGLAEGQTLQRGDPIGAVGSTGNASADAPHLHFEVQLLGPEKQWWHATSINPYGRFAGQP
jgi:murein DD-endopeptidase MepM/ murein hydrolase activator NlpD